MNLTQYGASGSVPLLVIHGLFGSSRNWNSVARSISANLQIPVFALDVRNHNYNQNSKFCGPMSSWSELTKDLDFFVQQNLESRPFFILGHSLGGQIVMNSLLTNSNVSKYAKKAIIVDVSLRHPAPANLESDHLYKLMSCMNYINGSKFKSRASVVEALQKVEYDEHVRNFLLTNLQKDSDGTFSFSRLHLKNIFEGWPKLKEDWTRCISEFRPWDGEVHFVKGQKSNYIDGSKGDVQEISKYFPKFQMREIENSGHWPHFDNSIKFLQILQSILKQ